MATGSLGSLVISLEANTAKLESDLGKAGYLLQKQAQAMSVKTIAIGTAIGSAIGHFATEMVEKVAEIIPQTIERMDMLSKAAQKVGLPTEEFSKLNYAAGLADVQMETLEKSLGKLTKSQAAALNVTSQQAKLFDALGISIKNTDGSLRPASQVLGQFADRFQQLKGSPEAIAAGIALFGRNFQEIIPLLKNGSAGIAEAADEADRFHVTLSEATGQAAEEANDNIKRLHSVFQGLTQQVAAELLPQINQLLTWAINFTSDGANAAGIARDIATALHEIVTAGKDIATIAGYVDSLNGALDKFHLPSIGDILPGQAGIRLIKQQLLDGHGQNEAAANDGSFIVPSQLQIPGLNKPAFSAVPLNSYGQQSVDAAKLGAALRGVFDGTEKVTKANQAHAASVGDVQGAYKQFEDTLGRIQGFLSGPLIKAEEQHKRNLRDLNDLAVKGKVSHEELAHALQVEAQAYAKEQDEIHSRYQTEIAALQGPVAKAEDDHRLALREINQLVAEGQLSGEGLAAALREEAKAFDQATVAAKRQADPMATLMADMQTAIDLVGKSSSEQAVYNELIREGKSVTDAYAQSLFAEARMHDTVLANAQKNVQLMDTFRSDLADLGVTALNNFGQVGNSFKKMMDDIFQQIQRRIIENWIDGLFGQQGTNGQGTQGGGMLGSLFSGLFGGGNSSNPHGYTDNAGPGANDGSFGSSSSGGSFWGSVATWASSLFGGGHADGGPTMRGRFYEVGELDRPELYSEGGRSYLLPGNSGNVTPITAGGGQKVVNNYFSMSKRNDNRSERQVAKATGIAIRQA